MTRASFRFDDMDKAVGNKLYIESWTTLIQIF